MTISSDLFREIVMRYEAGVAEKERQLDDFRRKSEAYVAYLEAEIAADRDRLDRFRTELDKGTSQSDRPPMPSVSNSFPSTPRIATPSPPNTGNQSEIIRQAAKEILREAGGVPMMQNEIRQKMEQRGVRIVSQDANELIRAALKRGSEFTHTRHMGWTLADRQS